MAADAIEVVSRSAKGSEAVSWTGYADGRYTVGAAEAAEVGTTVTLRPRAGAEHWLTPATVHELALSYARLLDVEVTVGGERITEPQALGG